MILRNLHWPAFLFFMIAISCAKQIAPTGGPKDTIPPDLESSIPRQNQINYKGKTIELTFSEMVMLTNPKEQIIIAPTTTNEYEIINRNNKVIIKFDDDLKDSVTYSLNFRDAVKDVTEKNPAANLQLAFSTGSYVDSLSISGNVYELFKGTIPKEATVAVFQKNDTLSIFKHKPSYLTKTDKDGNFKLNNLKHGEYSIYAIEDKNRNIIADSKSEFYGFLTTPIILKKDTGKISIPIVKLDARTLKLTASRPYNNYFNIKTGKYLADYQASINGSQDSLISAFGEDYANVRIYNTFDTDSTQIRFAAQDSIGNSIDTMLYIKFNTRSTTPEKFSMNAEQARLLGDKGQLDVYITFNKPAFLVNPDSLLFLIDSANVISLKNETLKWDHKNNKLNISAKINPSFFKEPEPEKKPTKSNSPVPRETQKPKRIIKNLFFIGKGTFVSIDQDSSVHFEKSLIPEKTDELSVLLINVQVDHTHFITELLNKDMTVIRRSVNTKSIVWEDLTPGDYKIRLIIDSNKNGKWDPGNYFKKEEPEPVTYYQNPKSIPPNITHVKANWRVGPLLITY